MSEILKAQKVFASLAILIIKFIGFKNAEMAEERRFSTITGICPWYTPKKGYLSKNIPIL